MEFVPFVRMQQRLARDLEDSDSTYWWSLLYYGELITKLVAAGFVAGINDDPDRLRYTQAYRLVRASGIGEWTQTIDEVLTGPPAQFLAPQVQEAARATTQKVGVGWQYEAVMKLAEVVARFDSAAEPPPGKPALRHWFSSFAQLRNKTRGHGAPLGGALGTSCPTLRASLDLVATQHPLFAIPWAFLHQNLSGKYRVDYLNDTRSDLFEKLKRERAEALPSAVYLDLGRPARVELLTSDPDLTDFFSPNGDFSPKRYELRSYITNATQSGDAAAYAASPKDLPAAATEGLGALEIHGQCFTNLPACAPGYVARPKLEEQLEQVLLDERRLIVTLHGPGGAGKTSSALTVLHRITNRPRFEVIVWFSARDIELLPEGPKPVRPRVLAEKDVARDYATLLQPPNMTAKFDAVAWMASELASAGAGPTLFVFDNFETVTSPEELFSWLDHRIRAPNKVLITTRLRSFNGDFQVAVGGMEDEESRELIEATASSLGIQSLITDAYSAELIREADGHPYVMKVLLGEVAKAKKLVRLERIVGDREHILTALFERTYERLPPAAKRLFLTIGRWRSLVPLLGLGAVVLRPQNERIDLEAALEELEKSSLIERHISPVDRQEFVSAPLAAALFAQRKLRTDRLKNTIEADVQALLDFGASQESDLRHGIRPRVEQLFRAVSRRAAQNPRALEADLPVLEFVARSYPDAWRLLSLLFQEVGGEHAVERAQQAVRRFLETEGTDRRSRRDGWRKLADLAQLEGDGKAELNAWAEFAEVCGDLDDMSHAANRINNIFRERPVGVERDEKRVIVERVISAFTPFERQADGTTLSRIAWLYCNIGKDAQAKEITRRGLDNYPDNDHLTRLAERLGVQHPYD